MWQGKPYLDTMWRYTTLWDRLYSSTVSPISAVSTVLCILVSTYSYTHTHVWLIRTPLNVTRCYSMIYTLPWVTPGTPVNYFSVTAINFSNWDKRESSTWAAMWRIASPLDHNQSRTMSGITVAYSVWCWLILHKFNSSEYLQSARYV
jgi:hypothetical protein